MDLFEEECALGHRTDVDPALYAGHQHPRLDSIVAFVVLLANLPLPDHELKKICEQASLADSVLPIGIMQRIGYRNIRPFLHPDSDQVTLRELRGRYLVASVFLEVATSFVLGEINLPRANRVFWRLGGAMFLVPLRYVSTLQQVLQYFNEMYGIPEIGFELDFAESGTNHESGAASLLIANGSSNDGTRSGRRDKLAGWGNSPVRCGREEAAFVSQYATSLARSPFWCVRRNRRIGISGEDLASKIGRLPYWIHAACEDCDHVPFAREHYLADSSPDCSYVDVPLSDLIGARGTASITYYRLDIAGMRKSLVVENGLGLQRLYEHCHQMGVFFRETIPAICRSINRNRRCQEEVALLHSTCDDAILVVRGENPDSVVREIQDACFRITGQALAYGGAVMESGLTANDLSHAAMRQLVASRNGRT